MNYVKRINIKLTFYEYLIKFSYETIKGYYREQERVMYSLKAGCVSTFFKWAYKQRTMTNVQILAIERTNKEPKIIEL